MPGTPVGLHHDYGSLLTWVLLRIIIYYTIILNLKGVANIMITKSIKLDDILVEDLELVAKGLNEKAGADVYDFSNIVRVALNQYLNSENIKEIIESVRQREFGAGKDMLLASESSLNKDWQRPEEDKAWANL
jgi:hypothetical protein